MDYCDVLEKKWEKLVLVLGNENFKLKNNDAK